MCLYFVGVWTLKNLLRTKYLGMELSLNDFTLSAATFSDKWKMFNPSFPPYLWTTCPKHHLGSPKVEGFLSLENVCLVKSSEVEESNRSLAWKEESNLSEAEEPFDDATLVCMA
ncbi:hypothetical protein RYX36_024763 [Vicia faba]